MITKATVFSKQYDGESLADLNRDISECFNSEFNKQMQSIPEDEFGFYEGTFTVTVVWRGDDQ